MNEFTHRKWLYDMWIFFSFKMRYCYIHNVDVFITSAMVKKGNLHVRNRLTFFYYRRSSVMEIVRPQIRYIPNFLIILFMTYTYSGKKALQSSLCRISMIYNINVFLHSLWVLFENSDSFSFQILHYFMTSWHFNGNHHKNVACKDKIYSFTSKVIDAVDWFSPSSHIIIGDSNYV